MDIVCITGLWMPVEIWEPTAERLREKGHQVHLVALPGQDDGSTTATLDDQLEAVLNAVDACERPPLVVGHSAACTLAALAADRRPDTVAGTALIGGVPSEEGEEYAAFFELVDGVMPFPGWEPFEGPDSADLDEATRADLADRALPVAGGVATGVVHWSDERRHQVPMTLVCPEFTPDEAREWIDAGDVPELAAHQALEMVDIDSGHWPMVSAPEELARVLDEVAQPLT